jgi:pSer/pThr/pTyr-binding forkhead associated (FHA) protein
VRATLAGGGCRLAFRDDDARTRLVAIERGWTRIGRSPAAEVFLDDPSVSRRHAMIVAEPGKQPQVLDDRSLNGILVNGRPVELAPLGDGDELAVGRFRLYLLQA